MLWISIRADERGERDELRRREPNCRLHPLLLGAGKRLFREYPNPLQLRLTECTPTTTGVLLLTYEREPMTTERIPVPSHLTD